MKIFNAEPRTNKAVKTQLNHHAHFIKDLVGALARELLTHFPIISHKSLRHVPTKNRKKKT